MPYEEAILTTNDLVESDKFGNSVKILGNTAIVGCPGKDTSTGAAYIFTLNGTSWTQQAKLTADDGAIHDLFSGGSGVSISGNTAIVGASIEDSAKGAAYTFVFNGTSWIQQAKLTANDGATNDRFGCSVDISGNTAIVGAYLHDSFKGAAYIYIFDGISWTQQAKLTANDVISGDEFGVNVAISDNKVMVGTTQTNAAYIYVFDGTSWIQQAELTVDDGPAYYAIAISGNTAIVGSPNKGAAYVYVFNGTSWIQQAELIANDGQYAGFGTSVAISDNRVIIGAPAGGSITSAAYIFFFNGTAWEQQLKLTASDGTPSDGFGSDVSMSEGTAIVGAQYKNSYRGAAYIYYVNQVFYYGNGNTSGSPPVDNANYQTGDSAIVGPLAKTGYIFEGWNTKPDGTGIDYAPGDILPIGPENILLYAKWFAPQITYIGNTNTSGNPPVDFNHYSQGQFVIVLGNIGSLEKTNYIFAGWNTKADGTGTNYIPGSNLLMRTERVILYAKWAIPSLTRGIKLF